MRYSRSEFLVLASAVFPALGAAQAGTTNVPNSNGKLFGEKPPSKREGPERPLQGVVRDPNDKLVEGAVVHLTDLDAKTTRSFITKEKGVYQFDGLKKDIDYEVRAEYNDMESPTRRISRLDPIPKVVRNLTLEPKSNDEEEEAAKAEEKK